MQYFNIQVASQLSGVASATIRAWEKRYNAVIPDRAENKHRLYSEKDIEKLALLHKLTEIGQSIGKIAHLDLNELKEIYLQLMHRPYVERNLTTPVNEKVDIQKILNSFFLALSAYKIDILTHELEKAKDLLTPRELCLEILVPLFHTIGAKVENNTMSIAQEHTISALFRFYLGQMIWQHYQKSLQHEESILITTPEGELHELGILGATLLCVHYGLKIIYLGTNLPALSLVEAANALNPKAILIGSTAYESPNHPNLLEYLSMVKSHLKVKPHICIGGKIRQDFARELLKNNALVFSNLKDFDEYLASH